MNIFTNNSLYTNNIKSLLPFILRHTFKFIDIIPFLSKVLHCQLERESFYSKDDLDRIPGLVNILIQSQIMKKFVYLSFLSFGGTLVGNDKDYLVLHRDNLK